MFLTTSCVHFLIYVVESLLFTSRAMLNKLFLFIIFLKSCDAADTLSTNETVGFGQTLVSENQVFEAGFFTPGASTNSFFGIWYRYTPGVVVWVANRNNPIPSSQGGVFSVSEQGNLSVSRGGSMVWSSNPSMVASDPVLHLLNNGNLVLVETSKQGYLWQSFDSPTDNWQPGMKLIDDSDGGVENFLQSWRSSDDPSPGDFVYRIENRGLPELVLWRETKKMFRTGTWNGVAFGGIPPQPNGSVNEYSFKDGRLIFLRRPISSSVFSRITLEPSGLLQRYNMNARNDTWNAIIRHPRDKCDEYSNCGPNALCSTEKPQICECFKGFAPKSEQEWGSQDWSSGCTRVTELNCESGDGFLEVTRVKYPDMLRIWLNDSMRLDECKDECLKNCSCTAFANPYITDGGSGCLMWFGDLIDIRQFPGADDKQNLHIRVPASELVPTTNGEEETEEKKSSSARRLVVIYVTSGALTLALFSGGVLFVLMRKKRASKGKNEDLDLKIFKLETIVTATNNFSLKNMIGEGGFGPVFKGSLCTEGEIAVKRLSRTSQQGIEEFKNEVILIAKLQHRNLVRLLGCCIEGEERMLVYEYLQNKSLNYFIFDENRKELLTWPIRFDIILGIARGLLYLHQDSRLKIIHRDLKTSNILLDKDQNPKISDFGLARIFGEGQSIATTKRVAGTVGYMAPEYAIYGKYSVKSDIFAFGVMLLEIVSGRKTTCLNHSNDDPNLLGHAWLLRREDNILKLMDECLSDSYVESQVKRCIQVGLLCVQKSADDRPLMSSVVFMLGNEEATIPQPKEAGFFPEESSTRERSSSQQMITITDLEAR